MVKATKFPGQKRGAESDVKNAEKQDDENEIVEIAIASAGYTQRPSVDER